MDTSRGQPSQYQKLQSAVAMLATKVFHHNFVGPMELVETTTLPYCINLNINVGIYYYYFVEITYSILWKFLMVHIHDENYLKIFVHAILKKHKKGFFFQVVLYI